VIKIRQSTIFAEWMADLRDIRAKAKIAARIDRMALGHPVDVEPVGEGVGALRIHYGPGYRVYFARHGQTLIVYCAAATRARRLNTSRPQKRLRRN